MNELLIEHTASAYTYPLLIKNLLAFLKGFVDSGRLFPHALMLKFMVVDEIAKTGVGKIDKKLLR